MDINAEARSDQSRGCSLKQRVGERMETKTQKGIVILAVFLALVSIQLSLAVLESSALDNPHNAENNVSCQDCHSTVDRNPAYGALWWTDQENGVCGSCHDRRAPLTQIPTGIRAAECAVHRVS